MGRPSRSELLVGAALLALAAGVVCTITSTGDYVPGGSPAPGNAAPPLQALLDGDLDRYFAAQPLLGSFSLLLRFPFAGLADLLGGGALAVYRAGAFACLLGPVALGAGLNRAMERRGRPLVARLIVAGLCVVNPATVEALQIGHPEEPLAAALVVAGVVAAARRPLVSGLLLGLGVATKQWAVLALPVALVAARGRRVAMVAVALVAAACLLLPASLADPDAASAVRDQVLDLRSVNVLSVWWPVAPAGPAAGPQRVLPLGLSRADVAPLVALVAVGLALVLGRRGRPTTERALALLALVLMLRCALDPSNLQYYGTGPMLAVIAWDALARTGLPVIAVLYAAASWAVFGPLLRTDADGAISAGYLALTALFAGYLATAAFAPRRLDLREASLAP